MGLEDTIGLMCSDDYKDRMKAEYIQLKVRIRSLKKYLTMSAGLDNGLMEKQLRAMKNYCKALRDRMTAEEIAVDAIDNLLRRE